VVCLPKLFMMKRYPIACNTFATDVGSVEGTSEDGTLSGELRYTEWQVDLFLGGRIMALL